MVKHGNRVIGTIGYMNWTIIRYDYLSLGGTWQNIQVPKTSSGCDCDDATSALTLVKKK